MTSRTALRRHPERAAVLEIVHEVLDQALHCHAGVVRDGSPVVLPTIHARLGDTLYLHGSPAAGMLRDGRKGVELCVTATIVDGLVLAKSVFSHSMNYRSAVVFGTARRVTDPDEKLTALEAITEHVAPGRWSVARLPTERELRETEVLALAIDEWSAKVRTGPPVETVLDDGLDVWSGVIPVSLVEGEPVSA